MLAERDLVRLGLPVVQAVAKRIARRLGGWVNIDDPLGMGNIALLEVARTYDPARATFAAYAAWKVKWAMLDGLRRETHGRSAHARVLAVMAAERLSEEPEPESDDPTTQEDDQNALAGLLDKHAAAVAIGLLAGPTDLDLVPVEEQTPEDQLSRAQTVRAAYEAVGALPERERALIERHYFGGEAFDMIARDLGISKSWASRLHSQALAAMAVAMGARPAPGLRAGATG
jgi:RNA polymerase sigma factor for flagellar operon FliA